jgi:hypothetical protein
MKFNFIQIVIALSVCLLISYGFYNFCNPENKLLVSIGSFLFIGSTLVLSLGVRFELPRTTTVIRTLSGVYFIVALLSNFIFSITRFSDSTYIILNGILLLSYISILYKIVLAKQ